MHLTTIRRHNTYDSQRIRLYQCRLGELHVGRFGERDAFARQRLQY